MASPSAPILLRPSNLDLMQPRVTVPAYDRSTVGVGIVHVGVGNFHRAHQAVYVDEILHRQDASPWGVCGVGLLHGDRRMRDALAPQSGLYTLIERDEHDEARVIGSVVHYLYAPDDPEAVLEVMASPATRIVSLTITEGGYPVDLETGAFDPDHPEIFRQEAAGAPRSTFGYLLEALRRRRERGLEPFTVMSCDNVEGNGDVARNALLGLAGVMSEDIRDWIGSRAAFPNSVVDRITPATTVADRALVRERYGVEDACPVVTESFRQWVMEDSFSIGRPEWEEVGVQMVRDVRPYELLKLRCLNGGHSAIAYPGALLGYEFIHEIARDEIMRRYLRALWDNEVIPTLPDVPGVDVGSYTAALLDRFSNPATGDRTERVCMDGSSKLPSFILPAIRERLRSGRSIRLLCFVIASWCRFLAGRDDAGRPIVVDDPLSKQLQAAARAGPGAVLNVGDVFGRDLRNQRALLAGVGEVFRDISLAGTRAALERLLREEGERS